MEGAVATVRAFNRFYTKVIGLLGEGLLETTYSLTEVRVLYELAHARGIRTATLREELALDAGYLSRILARFEADGLVRREPSKEDGRRRVVHLTPKGRWVFRSLDRRSAADVKALLARLGSRDQKRLVGAMRTIEDVLTESAGDVRLRPPRSGDYGWVIERHGAIYRDEYDWDETFEALVARIVAEYVERGDTEREAAWIAEAGGTRVGCVFCVKRDETTAQLRILLVEPTARDLGVGTKLVDECIAFARANGYEKIALWTNDVLVDARRIYERAGFELVEEGKHHSFGKDLVEQTWSLSLGD